MSIRELMPASGLSGVLLAYYSDPCTLQPDIAQVALVMVNLPVNTMLLPVLRAVLLVNVILLASGRVVDGSTYGACAALCVPGANCAPGTHILARTVSYRETYADTSRFGLFGCRTLNKTLWLARPWFDTRVRAYRLCICSATCNWG